ncbi:DsbA family oxidoreductase [Wenyingzhuangia sp. IMCC45533]
MNKAALQIELVYDIICPWCYIGHHRLLKAIKTTNVEVIKLLPYQLRPHLPQEGISTKDYWKQKGITDIETAYKDVKEAAESEGIVIAPLKFNRIPNTLKIHQVVMLAEEKGLGVEVLQAIQTAYFKEGLDLTKMTTVLEVTEDFLSGKEIKKAWESEDFYETMVFTKEQKVKSKKISVVPTYIVNDKHRISGAVSNYTMLDMLKQLTTDKNHSGFCEIDSDVC